MRRTDITLAGIAWLLLSVAAACGQGVGPGTGDGGGADDPAKKRDCAALRDAVASDTASPPAENADPKAAINDLGHRAEKLAAIQLATPDLAQLANDLATNLRELSKAMSAIDAVSAKQAADSDVRSAAIEGFECKKEPDACRAFLGPIIGLGKLSPTELDKMIVQVEKVEFNDPGMIDGAKKVVLSLRSLQASASDLATANEAIARAGTKLDALSQTFDRLCP